MNSSSSLHLHKYTEYSMLDGAAKVKPMLAEAQRLQMPSSHHPRYRAFPARRN